jgi:hypothetical protein
MTQAAALDDPHFPVTRFHRCDVLPHPFGGIFNILGLNGFKDPIRV